MNLFDDTYYRKYLKKSFHKMPKSGHGQSKRMAEHLGVSTTLISQILNEEKHFTLDQAYLATEFLGLTELETQYFLLLVQIDRAANINYKRRLQRDLEKIKSQSQRLETRLTHQKVLTDEQRAVFYSDWIYSAIRMLTSIDGFHSAEKIAQYLGLPRKQVVDALHFLETAQLVIQEKGQYKIGPLSTYTSADSPWVRGQLANWRLKAIEFANYPDPQKLHYTSPMTLSASDAEKIRSRLVQMIDEVGRVVDDSPAQQLMCFNLDWFQIHDQSKNAK